MTISEQDVEDLGKSPKRVRTIEGTVEERSVEDLIKADRHTAVKAAADAVPWGIRIARSKPGSSLGGG